MKKDASTVLMRSKECYNAMLKAHDEGKDEFTINGCLFHVEDVMAEFIYDLKRCRITGLRVS